MLNFIKSLFCICWDNPVVLSLVLFMWWITFIDVCMLNQHCIPGMKPTWLWWITFFDVLLDSVCKSFVEEWFTANYVVNSRVGEMWCWEQSIFCGFGVSIFDLSILLIWALIAIYFPLETALNVSQGFWYVVSLVSLVSMHLYFCLHFIVYPVSIQEPVVQFPCSYVVLS